MTDSTGVDIGDVVRVVLRKEYKTPHSGDILGVVRSTYVDNDSKKVTAYGVESSGEIIFYSIDQIERVQGVVVEQRNGEDTASHLKALMLVESFLC